jgi:hypothetical protein
MRSSGGVGNWQQAIGNRSGVCALLLLLVLLMPVVGETSPQPSPTRRGSTLRSALTLTVSPRRGSTSHSRIIVVVANRLVLSDLDDPKLPTIHKMLHTGGIGLISPNCVGPKTEASVLLTANTGSPVNTGSRAKAESFVKEFYDADEVLPDGEKAGNAFASRTGWHAPKGSAVFLGLGQTLRETAKLSSVPAKLGALGDALRKAGVKTGIEGNADVPPDVVDRSAAALVMDSRGIVDSGGLPSDLHTASPELRGTSVSKGGQRSTALRYDRRASGLLSASGVVASAPIGPNKTSPPTWTGKSVGVIYFGASTVVDEQKPSMSDSAYAAHRTEALKRLDGLLRDLISRPEAKGVTIILVSFSPPTGAAWDQLTPIIVYPSTEPGLLATTTTRTPGIIAASDFAPTVLGLLGLPPSDDMIGRAATVVPEARGLKKLTEMGTRVTANQRVLTPVAVFLVALGALSFTPAALIVAFGLKPTRRIVTLLKAGLVVGSTTFAELLLAVLAPAGAVGYVLGTAVSMVLLTSICLGLAALIRHKVTVRALPVALVYAATAVIILADAVTGCYLCKWCGPSSYQITGMRFYGVGNEYAGVLISTGALAALFLGRGKWVVPIVGAATILALGLGNLGANYGGTAAAVVTFTLLWLAVSRGGFAAKHVVLAFGLAIAAIIGFAALDWTLAGQAGSHAARATGLTEKLGAGYLWSLAMRKVLFNLRITFSMDGLHYALAFVPFLALWFGGVQGKVRTVFKDDPRIVAGMKAVLIGAVAAFMLNDSGIIFAGIMMAMTMLMLLYSLLEELRVERRELPPGSNEGEARPCPES